MDAAPEVLVQGESAVTPLRTLLGLVYRPQNIHTSNDGVVKVSCRLFQRSAALRLLQVLEEGNRGVVHEGRREQSIWRSMMMRTSFHPVDMAFSIMGILGVTLDPREYENHERDRAMLALARGVLRAGGRAHWLAGTIEVNPNAYSSLLPLFPSLEITRKTDVDAREVGED